jgi:hypothetical protein
MSMIIKDTSKQTTLKLESKLPMPNTMKDILTTSKFEPKLPIPGIIKKNNAYE